MFLVSVHPFKSVTVTGIIVGVFTAFKLKIPVEFVSNGVENIKFPVPDAVAIN